MNQAEVIAALRKSRANRSAVGLANLLNELTDGGLSQASLVTYFKQAFPEIPLRVLLEAGTWHRLSAGEMSDENFDSLLAPYLMAPELLQSLQSDLEMTESWTDVAELLVPFLRDVIQTGWKERPSTCPHCGEQDSVHIYFDRDPGGPIGSIWGWCSCCRRYEHGSIQPPLWWRNHPSVNRSALISSPEPLDHQADVLDRHWAKLGEDYLSHRG